MRSLKISVPGLFRLFVLPVVLLLSFQAQAMCGCDDRRARNDPEKSFREADLVATIRFVGFVNDSWAIRNYRIVRLVKAPPEAPSVFGTGSIIVIDFNPAHECLTNIRAKGITLAFLSYRSRSSKDVFMASICYPHAHESEEGYAERIRWLDERIKHSSR